MRDYSEDKSDQDFPDPEIGPFGDQYEDLVYKLKHRQRVIKETIHLVDGSSETIILRKE